MGIETAIQSVRNRFEIHREMAAAIRKGIENSPLRRLLERVDITQASMPISDREPGKTAIVLTNKREVEFVTEGEQVICPTFEISVAVKPSNINKEIRELTRKLLSQETKLFKILDGHACTHGLLYIRTDIWVKDGYALTPPERCSLFLPDELTAVEEIGIVAYDSATTELTAPLVFFDDKKDEMISTIPERVYY